MRTHSEGYVKLRKSLWYILSGTWVEWYSIIWIVFVIYGLHIYINVLLDSKYSYLYLHIIVINSEIDCLSVCLWFTRVVLNLLLGNLKLYLCFIKSTQHCNGANRSYPSPIQTRAHVGYTVNMVNDKTIQGISSHGIDAVSTPESLRYETVVQALYYIISACMYRN